MRFFKQFRKYPFLLMLGISSLILTIIGFAGKSSIYSDYKIVLANTPQLAAVLEGAGEGKYPWMLMDQRALQEMGSKDELVSAQKEDSEGEQSKEAVKDITDKSGGKDIKGTTSSAGKDNKDQSKNTYPGKKNTGKSKKIESKDKNLKDELSKNKDSDTNSDKKENTSKSDSKNTEGKQVTGKASVNHNKSYEDPEAEEDTKEDTDNKDNADAKEKIDKLLKNKDFQFGKVSRNYFDDALFIGDSRTVGLSEYSVLKKSTFYADVGLTIYDVFDKKVAEVGGDKKTVLEALQMKQFKKIYIMLGINELGTGTDDEFAKQYSNVIKKIRKLQPDAIIYIEAIMNVAKEKSDTDPLYNNVNITRRNNSIAVLADNSSVFYIDVNDSITDKRGNLPSKYTFDSIHLKAAYYKLWTDFLFTHGVHTKAE